MPIARDIQNLFFRVMHQIVYVCVWALVKMLISSNKHTHAHAHTSHLMKRTLKANCVHLAQVQVERLKWTPFNKGNSSEALLVGLNQLKANMGQFLLEPCNEWLRSEDTYNETTVSWRKKGRSSITLYVYAILTHWKTRTHTHMSWEMKPEAA